MQIKQSQILLVIVFLANAFTVYGVQFPALNEVRNTEVRSVTPAKAAQSYVGSVNVTSQVLAAQKASQSYINGPLYKNSVNSFFAALGLSQTPFYVAPNTWVSPSSNGTLTKWSVTAKPVR